MSTLPVVLCGKSPTLAQNFISALEHAAPQVNVVHVIHDLSTAQRELRPLFTASGSVSSSSSLGADATPASNAKAGRAATPRAIIVGKGFSDDEVASLRAIHGVAEKVAWLLPDDSQMTWMRIAKVAGSAGTALPGVIAERVVKCLEKNGAIGRDGKVLAGGKGGEGEVWYF